MNIVFNCMQAEGLDSRAFLPCSHFFLCINYRTKLYLVLHVAIKRTFIFKRKSGGYDSFANTLFLLLQECEGRNVLSWNTCRSLRNAIASCLLAKLEGLQSMIFWSIAETEGQSFLSSMINCCAMSSSNLSKSYAERTSLTFFGEEMLGRGKQRVFDCVWFAQYLGCQGINLFFKGSTRPFRCL